MRRNGVRRREVFQTRDEAVDARASWLQEATESKRMRRLSRWRVDGNVARIEISGTTVTVDAVDVEELSDSCWRITPDGYVASDACGPMHRHLMHAAPRDIVDHINNDRADNRRSNLRIVDHSVNNHNRACKCRGVRRLANGRFFGRIVHCGKVSTTPMYGTFEEALAARNAEARRLFGDFARMQ